MIRRPQSRHTGARSVDLDGAARLMEKRAIIAALLVAALHLPVPAVFLPPAETPPRPVQTRGASRGKAGGTLGACTCGTIHSGRRAGTHSLGRSAAQDGAGARTPVQSSGVEPWR